ncbi:hypothetical protein [Devosia sp.]|uniref:hypothetical protein n=2 Tax=Hyphomicrobiales TaxID=356 RepID=UPI0027368765|nr:hypothetical protein [Devosia sp.]MDP2780931.1 hypothetical protein [Devosia sp.]
MRLLSVSVGTPRTILHSGEEVSTAIFKFPVSGSAMARRLGIDGDIQVNQQAHGGPDKPVLAFPIESYDFYEFEFGQPPSNTVISART